MSRGNPGAPDALPANRSCRMCGAATRFSHTSYVRAGESVALYVCTSCGTTHSGGLRGGDRPPPPGRDARSGGRASRRPPVDEGPPANPVIDEDMARLLRESLGGQQ
ncbi:MAG TPA: hypothetical protein VGL20_00165 [Candidatus Dormibacteraeota bacterium]